MVTLRDSGTASARPTAAPGATRGRAGARRTARVVVGGTSGESTVREVTDWHARCLDAVDERAEEMTDLLCSLVRVPSVTGTDAEHDLLSRLATRLSGTGLDVDHWQIPLPEVLAADGFPG